MESSNFDALAKTQKVGRFDKPVSVLVTSYRAKLTDHDNVCVKFAIDAIVHRGILQDDSPAFVESVTIRQVKVKNESEEKTVVVLREV